MITDIRFVSLKRINSLKPRGNVAVISILDNSERSICRESFNPDGWGPSLAFSFEDSAEEHFSAFAGEFWPLQPDITELRAINAKCSQERECIPVLRDAEAMWQFASRLHALPRKFRLLVHCKGGMSRSSAVAKALSTKLNVPVVFSGMRTFKHANPRVLRLFDAL